MPGLSFIYDFTEDISKKESIILQSLDSLIHFEEYKRKILLKKKFYFLGYTKYKEYPIISFETNKYCIYLEGKIYGKDYQTIKSELNELSELIFQNQTNTNKQISDWLLNTDGEFIIFILDKKSYEVAFLNDALGHLPLYYYKNKSEIYISREIKFIANFIKKENFNKISLANYLLFSYTLGKETLFNNIFRLEPSSLIKINSLESHFEIKNIYQLNFDCKTHCRNTINKNVTNLISLLNATCGNKSNTEDNFVNVLSLSGGLDSRIVAAALRKCSIPFSGVTYLDFDKVFKLDTEIAEKVASSLNIDWHLFPLSSPKGKDFIKLLDIKRGMNYLFMSFILPFFRQIKKDFGNKVTYFTGDTGLCLRSHNLPKRIKDINHLIEFIISKHSMISINEVENLTRITKEEIEGEIKRNLLSYPEKSLQGKYEHFVIYSRCFNWHYEGIDRNRFFFWVRTPLESTPFFIYAINCPEKQKINNRLYREMLIKLSPKMSRIIEANLALPISSIRYRIKRYLISCLSKIISNYPKIMLKIRKKVEYKSAYKHNSNLIRCIQKQTIDCKSILEYLSYSELKNITDNCSKHGKQELDVLFTITSIIEEFECGKSSIEKYYEADFK